MSLARASRQYLGVRALLPPDLQTAARAPTSADKAYVKGTLWLDTADSSAFMWPGSGNWIALGSGTTGAIVTLTGGSGGAISPLAGNISILGTASQLTSTGSAGGHSITFSIPAVFIAPGSIASSTTITSGTAIVATTTLTAGTGITATTGNITASAGAVNAATSMTATAGDITATLGNVIINGAAKQLRNHGGAATDFIGTATLTSGTVTVANTNIAATDRIMVNRSAVNASTALGVFKVVKTAATNFIITACKPADATTETGDASTVEYFIVRQV